MCESVLSPVLTFVLKFLLHSPHVSRISKPARTLSQHSREHTLHTLLHTCLCKNLFFFSTFSSLNALTSALLLFCVVQSCACWTLRTECRGTEIFVIYSKPKRESQPWASDIPLSLTHTSKILYTRQEIRNRGKEREKGRLQVYKGVKMKHWRKRESLTCVCKCLSWCMTNIKDYANLLLIVPHLCRGGKM